MQIPDIGADRVIRDPVHGDVLMTPAEYELIQLPLVMRLHKVRQNSMAYLAYPGAMTSRFEHAIGTMFMGSKIAHRVLGRMAQKDFDALFPNADGRLDVELLIKSVRLACLFHDVGHGPFSHASEGVMASTISEEERKEAESLLGEEPSIHEYFSYKLMQVSEVGEIVGDPLLVEAAASLLVERPVAQIAKENPAGFAALRKIVSSQLDADRMDYLARDSLMSGVPYGRIDAGRIITNMAIVPDGRGKYELAVHHRALGAVEDMLDARFKMYKWVYLHHTVGVGDITVAKAIERMIDDGVLEKDLFHWKSFAKGLVGDEYIMHRIMRAWEKGDAKYANYRGLWDRRYFPASLLKHPADYSEFAKRVMTLTNRNMTDRAIVAKLAKLLSSPHAQKTAAAALSALPPPLRDADVVIKLGGGTPYRPPSSSDSIWLYTLDSGNVQLHELTKQSKYAMYITYEWENQPSVYMACVVPGLERKRVTPSMKSEIKDAIIKAAFG